MYAYDQAGDPIGPEPSRESPEQRAAWHQAFAALGPVGEPDVRAMPDGRLWLLRDTYVAETAWAPRHVGRELRLARLGAADADLGAIRAEAQAQAARKAGDHERSRSHETLANSYQAMRDHYRQQETAFAQAMADRQEWERATACSRRLAIAADAELRRRHLDTRIEPLRSGEPTPVRGTALEQRDLAPDQKIGETAAWIRDLAAQRPAFRATMDERRRLTAPGKDPGWGDHGEAFPARRALKRDAILQPPKPQITPSARVFHLAHMQDIEPEAAD